MSHVRTMKNIHIFSEQSIDIVEIPRLLEYKTQKNFFGTYV